jgi:actin-like ATPase involved in cell morphogenesis
MEDVRRNGHHEGASRGSAVQIVNVRTLPNAPSRFILEKTPFRQILSEVGKRPIYLLSIAGASRQGKSFLMNVILHYLEELEKGAAGGGGVDAWDSIASLHSVDGFHIENRNVRDTIGIWMWSKPFVFKQSSGQEIAILLMDTQGVFDKFSTKREWAMIVGLSLLTSSCLIYNLLNNLQEDNLEIFTNFVEFGMLSLQGNENATSVFQKLLFLIRDWGFPNDNPYGSVGGSTFIQEQLKVVPEIPEELRKVRKKLTNVFEEIECFLMPHPGNAAKENNYSGSLRPLEPVFLKNLKSFLENLIIIDELKPLHIGGTPVTGVELMAYFSKYIELLNGQKIAKPVSLHDATVEANLDSIVEDCVCFVKKAIDEAMTEDDFIPLAELKVICERYTHQGIDRFKQKVVGQESRQVSKYCGALTENLTVLMDGYAKRNDEMKTAFILKLLDIAEVAYEKKVADSVKNMTHSLEDFEDILEKCKEEVVEEMDFGDRNEDFFTEVTPQVRAVFSKLDESYRQTNSDRLQTVESDYKKCFDDLLRDYDDRMETAVPDDELDSITPMKLAKSHERCEQRIVTQFLAGMKFDNENLQRKALADLKAQTAARLANKSKKVKEIAQNSSNEALQILEKSMKRYHDGMADLLINGSPTDTQIQEKHELQRMMAETEFSSVVYVVKSREEASRLKDLLEKKIQEELESIQSQVRNQREQFRSRWNGRVDEVGKKYSEQMKSLLDSPKISSNAELKAHYEKLIERIVREAAQDSWLPPESREQMQSEVRQRLLEISGTFFSHHKNLLHEAEESAKNVICLFTKSHEKSLKDRINTEKDSLTEEEFKRMHEHLLGEAKLQFESKWSQRLPKNSLVELMDQFLNGCEGVFSTNLEAVQFFVQEKVKGIREIIKECFETYEIEIDEKMDLATAWDLGALEKYHKSAKMKAEKEFKKGMREYAAFPKAEEMKSEFEEEVAKIFERKKVLLQDNLAKLVQGMDDLGNTALKFYHEEMGNRKMDVSSEEGLRAAHKEVLEGAIKQFESNVAETLGNLTVAKLKQEKNKLEKRLAEELLIQLKDLSALTASRLTNKSKKVQEDLLERKIQEELESIQSQVRKQREDFRSRWNGQVDDAGKKYSEQMKSMLDSPKISSDSELKGHHDKLIEMIVREAAQDPWLPLESRELMQSDVRKRLLEISGTFFSHHKLLLQEAEESARNDICLFTKSHEKALKDRINYEKDSMTEEEFKRMHERLVGEAKLQFDSKWRQRLPKPSLVKFMDQFLNDGEGIYSTNMKTVQSLVRDKMKGIREIIKECSETYEMELDDKMDSANNSGDLGVLEKYHKSAKIKAEKEFKKAMKEYAAFPKAEEMKCEFEKEILKIFESKKVSLEKNLARLAQGMEDLRNNASKFYHEEMGNRKMDVSSEEGLRAAHKEVLEGAIKQFESNVAETLGNLTVAKLKQEKNKLEKRLAEELPLQVEAWKKMDQAIDAETRKVMQGVMKGYTAKMENKLQPYAYRSKQLLELEHRTLLREGLMRIKEAKKPKSKDPKLYEDQMQIELKRLFENYVKENDTNQRRVEQEILRSLEEQKEQFFSSIKQILNLSEVESKRQEFIRELKERYSRAYLVPQDSTVVDHDEMCMRLIMQAMEEVTGRWAQLERVAFEVDLAVRDMMKSYKRQMDTHISDDSPLWAAKVLNGFHNHVKARVMKELGGRSIRLTPKVTERMKSAMDFSFTSYKQMNDLKAAEKMDSAIGIDLGTTYSCVGVYRKGKVEIIPERNGYKKTIPSYVFFEPQTGNVVVGDSAKDQSQIHPHLAIFDSKRLIGRWFTDKEVRQEMKLWPFEVVRDKTQSSNRPKIRVENKTYFPEEISAKILETLKANAEAHLGHPVKKAVITVPAYFTDAQKVGTRNAAGLAGLEVLELLSEPISAAIAYNLNLNSVDDGDNAKNIFVYDLGGEMFDVSVLSSARGKLEVKAVGGYNHLGGQDFDNLMVRFCIDEFERKHGVKVEGPGATGSCLEKSVRWGRILRMCEERKKNLSETMRVRVILDRLHGELDMDVEVTREKFNRMIESLLQETIRLAKRALEDANMTVNDIGKVILGKRSVIE